ncbi:MAG: hypothetical protein LBN37_03305 [Bacteroidales bacterium]|jgi:hypothetical protein|nr:hypothetical protein [Bacteroidales bacterium]
MVSINGREYEFADITVMMGGRDIQGLRGINYKTSQEKEALYGKGNRAMSIQKGNIANEGELIVTQSELETMRASGGGSILGLSLNAVVAYGNPAQGDMMITDRLFGIQFTEESKEFKQGDKFAEITLPFVCLDIQYQS